MKYDTKRTFKVQYRINEAQDTNKQTKHKKIPPGAWMFVCCVLSGRGLCDELITRPEQSYRLWCVVVCDEEAIDQVKFIKNWLKALRLFINLLFI
jgi:hypothetical protein